MIRQYNYSTNKYETYYTEDEYKEIKDKLSKVEKLAKHYFRITCGAGGQSMNLMDRHSGMSQVGKEILEIIKEGI